SDPALPTDGENLCMQAAGALADAFGIEDGAALHLDKRVPYGAGLGSGSSDAAATLRLLTRLWDLRPGRDELHRISCAIGADVPFFLKETPAAYATGRGDDLTPLRRNGDPYRLPCSVLVAVPPVEVSTPEAYGRVTPNDADRPHLPSLLRTDDLARWRASLVNDFEAPIRAAYSEVSAAFDWLRSEGADYVSLSGSGGAVYGLFDDPERAKAVRRRGAERTERVHLTRPAESRPSDSVGS
ncbi:MAG: 4-(cytidine 5'-diphospho)-2-C-methyl-D-erythritol kinase, partial [Salinivenus sp.]